MIEFGRVFELFEIIIFFFFWVFRICELVMWKTEFRKILGRFEGSRVERVWARREVTRRFVRGAWRGL